MWLRIHALISMHLRGMIQYKDAILPVSYIPLWGWDDLASYLHNGISNTGKTASLYWIDPCWREGPCKLSVTNRVSIKLNWTFIRIQYDDDRCVSSWGLLHNNDKHVHIHSTLVWSAEKTSGLVDMIPGSLLKSLVPGLGLLVLSAGLILLNVHVHEPISLAMTTTGGRLNKKDGLTRYGDSHVKDKTSKRPSYL